MLVLLAAALAKAPDVGAPLETGASRPGDAALVVGIEDYAFVADVPYASRDAVAVRDWLVNTRGLPRERVEVFTVDATKEVLELAIERLAQGVETGGTFWFYFSGHGAADPNTGQRLLLGADVQSSPEAFASRSLRLSEIAALGRSRGGDVVLMVDACFSGVDRTGSALVKGPRLVVPDYAVEQLREGVVQLSAAGPNEFAHAMEASRHGAFTYFTLGALRGWADGVAGDLPDGAVTLSEANEYVSRTMWRAGFTNQRPEFMGDGNTVLIRGPLERAPLGLEDMSRLTNDKVVRNRRRLRGLGVASIFTGLGLAVGGGVEFAAGQRSYRSFLDEENDQIADEIYAEEVQPHRARVYGLGGTALVAAGVGVGVLVAIPLGGSR